VQENANFSQLSQYAISKKRQKAKTNKYTKVKKPRIKS